MGGVAGVALLVVSKIALALGRVGSAIQRLVGR